jgi:hypothetical protein
MDQSTKMTMKFQQLQDLYDSAETKDKEMFAEFRSNINLVSGKHYTNSASKYWNRIKEAKDLNQEQKLRLTKNHSQRIAKLYQNAILSRSPGVEPRAKNEREQQHVKAAELNKAVWHDIKSKHKFSKKVISYVKDFVDLGECAVKLFWDPMAGKLSHMEQEVDENGQPAFNEDGSPKAGRPIFSGDLVFERVWAFNLLIDPDAKTFEDARWVCVRKMVDTKTLKAKVGNDSDKLQLIAEEKDETFKVFDGISGKYTETKGQTLLKEFYFRPCHEYPTGYYAYATTKGIIFQGELPYELPFPIHWVGFDEIQTSSRCASILRVAKPYQIEINRASSQAAIAQITMGDDKIVYQTGAKMTAGALLPGVRGIQVSGMNPTILQGRDGGQFYTYIQNQINEMYQAVMLAEMLEDKQENSDTFTALFKSMKDKAKFVIYGQKFEEFLVGICEAALQIARVYYTEEMLVPAIGRAEYINVAEFKGTEPLCYKIEVVPMSDDVDSQMWNTMMINHTIQYAGSKLEKSDIGKLLKTVPAGNFGESFSDLTMDYDIGTNVILALDRGDNPYIPQFCDKKYLLKRLETRTTKADFPVLDQQIQARYFQTIQQLNVNMADEMEKLKALESEFIPTGGGRCKVDYYVETRPGKVERATIPVAAAEWLLKRLAMQGDTQERLMQLETGGQSAVAQELLQRGPRSPMGQQQGQPNPNMNPAA